MTTEIAKVEVTPASPPILSITFVNGEVSTFPMHPPVVAFLNAGGWLMREYIARVFEEDLGSTNMISRRIRIMQAGERPPESKTADVENAG